MVRIAVVEDDPGHRKTLVGYVRQFFSDGEAYECLTFSDGADYLAAARTDVDVLFLDIVMERSNGLEVARRVREADERVVIVFVTEAVQYALEGYTVQASDFLVKPLYYTSFRSAMLRALATLRRRAPRLVEIPFDKSSVLLDAGTIVFVETRGKRTAVHTTTGEYACNLTMRELEGLLGPHGFSRCHQAFIVNVAFIESIRKTEVVVRGHTVPISRNRREKFIETVLREVGATV